MQTNTCTHGCLQEAVRAVSGASHLEPHKALAVLLAGPIVTVLLARHGSSAPEQQRQVPVPDKASPAACAPDVDGNCKSMPIPDLQHQAGVEQRNIISAAQRPPQLVHLVDFVSPVAADTLGVLQQLILQRDTREMLNRVYLQQQQASQGKRSLSIADLHDWDAPMPDELQVGRTQSFFLANCCIQTNCSFLEPSCRWPCLASSTKLN